MPVLTALICGLVFGAGLLVSGMAQPGKVIAFLDVSGAWDPSLAFVMAGAIAVYAPVYHFVFRRRTEFAVPCIPSHRLDARLFSGSVLFGIGWGIGGFCPGPALTSVGTGAMPALIVVGAMLVGMALHRSLFGVATAADE